MKNLKIEGLTTVERKVHSIKGWRLLLALMLVAPLAALSAAGPTTLALADSGGVQGHTFDVTFTIWMTTLPAHPPSRVGVPLSGVVGGAVGNGSFAGKVVSDNLTVPGFWLGVDQFGFSGEKHSFVADVHIKHNATTGVAVITGVVTHGWLKGAQLTGGYATMQVCPMATPGNVFGILCFQGALHISSHQVVSEPASFTIPAGQCPNLPAGLAVTGSGDRVTVTDNSVNGDQSNFIAVSDVVQGNATGTNSQAYTFYSSNYSTWDASQSGPVKARMYDLFLLQTKASEANNSYVLRNGLAWRWTYTPPAGAYDNWPPASLQQSAFFGAPLNANSSARCDPF